MMRSTDLDCITAAASCCCCCCYLLAVVVATPTARRRALPCCLYNPLAIILRAVHFVVFHVCLLSVCLCVAVCVSLCAFCVNGAVKNHTRTGLGVVLTGLSLFATPV